MSDLIWLSDGAMRRIEPHFPRPHGVPRVDDRRIAGGIKNGLRWRPAPPRSPQGDLYSSRGYALKFLSQISLCYDSVACLMQIDNMARETLLTAIWTDSSWECPAAGIKRRLIDASRTHS